MLYCQIAYERLERNKISKTMKILRTYNGREFVNERLTTYLKEKWIIHKRTLPYTPEQNGKAERESRAIVECARTLQNSTELPRAL